MAAVAFGRGRSRQTHHVHPGHHRRKSRSLLPGGRISDRTDRNGGRRAQLRSARPFQSDSRKGGILLRHAYPAARRRLDPWSAAGGQLASRGLTRTVPTELQTVQYAHDHRRPASVPKDRSRCRTAPCSCSRSPAAPSPGCFPMAGRRSWPILGGGPNGAAFGPDGKCYICNNGGWQVARGFRSATDARSDSRTTT